ncbi:hypothetical protein VTN96DRAFT_3026 [Rasamsonia emersonii]
MSSVTISCIRDLMKSRFDKKQSKEWLEKQLVKQEAAHKLAAAERAHAKKKTAQQHFIHRNRLKLAQLEAQVIDIGPQEEDVKRASKLPRDPAEWTSEYIQAYQDLFQNPLWNWLLSLAHDYSARHFAPDSFMKEYNDKITIARAKSPWTVWGHHLVQTTFSSDEDTVFGVGQIQNPERNSFNLDIGLDGLLILAGQHLTRPPPPALPGVPEDPVQTPQHVILTLSGTVRTVHSEAAAQSPTTRSTSKAHGTTTMKLHRHPSFCRSTEIERIKPLQPSIKSPYYGPGCFFEDEHALQTPQKGFIISNVKISADPQCNAHLRLSNFARLSPESNRRCPS